MPLHGALARRLCRPVNSHRHLFSCSTRRALLLRSCINSLGIARVKLLKFNSVYFHTCHSQYAAGQSSGSGSDLSDSIFSSRNEALAAAVGLTERKAGSSEDKDDDARPQSRMSVQRMSMDPEMLIDFEGSMSWDVAADPLLVNKSKGSSDLRKVLNYMSAIGRPRTVKNTVNLGLVGVTFDSLKSVVSSIVKDCGVTESQAFVIAIGLRGNKPPTHLKDTIDILSRHSISLNNILTEQRKSLLALLVVQPEQLEERIKLLKELGLSSREIEQLDLTSLLLPLQDHLVERLRSLKNYKGADVDGLRGRSLRRLAPNRITVQCADADVETFISVEKVLIEMGITQSISPQIIDSSSNAATLRLNLVYLAAPPLGLSTSTLGILLSDRMASFSLTQYDERLIGRHVKSIIGLAELCFPEDPIVMLNQKIEMFPGLLNVTIDMEMRKALLARLIKETRERNAKKKAGSDGHASQESESNKSSAASNASTEKTAKKSGRAKKGKKGKPEPEPLSDEEQREKDIQAACHLFGSSTVLFAMEEKTLILLWRATVREPKHSLKKILKGYVFTRSPVFYRQWLANRKTGKKPNKRPAKSVKSANGSTIDPRLVQFFDIPGVPLDPDVS